MPKRSHLKTSDRRTPVAFSPRVKKWIYSGIAVAVAALLLGNKGFRTVVKNTLLLRRLHRELAAETREEERLQKSIAAVETDDRALEKAARKELGYVKPGEVEYRFPPPTRRQ